MKTKHRTTKEATGEVGISRATLQAWIAAGKFVPPGPTLKGARAERLWTKSDVARLRKTKAKIYWKGQGRPKKTK
jgi:predicted site-specific integrase-resolvase